MERTPLDKIADRMHDVRTQLMAAQTEEPDLRDALLEAIGAIQSICLIASSPPQ